MKKLAVVVLNYKTAELTLTCINSVLNSTYKDLIVFVVDNNSGDNIENLLKSKGVTFIQTGKNLGYAGGNNIGIKAALKKDVDFVLLLNPDTKVERKAINLLVEGLEKYKAGIVCPKIYFEDGKTIWYAGKDFDESIVLGQHRGVDQIEKGQFDKAKETEATGAAMLIRREVFEQIGFFDERYFLYLEDSDFSYRTKIGGFKIMYIPKAEVVHKNAQSTGLGSRLQDYYISRNRMLFATKFLPFKTRFALFREALRHLGNPVRRLALFDFLIGNFGKGSFHD